MSLRVVHVVPQFGQGGGGRAALGAARAAAAAMDADQAIACLLPPNETMAAAARARGIELLGPGSSTGLADALAGADVVHLHHWHSPESAELLEWDLPPIRLVVWPHVNGVRAPQILPPALVERAAAVVATSRLGAGGLEAAGATAPELIPPAGGWDRLAPGERTGADPFTVGYLGTVGYLKLHPEFPELCAAIERPGARFVTCGDGDATRSLPRRMAELGFGERFRALPHTDAIGPVLAGFDVFGSPLRPDSTASSDLVLKEAMYTGVPPVVLPFGGSDELVEDGVTGLVAADEEAYPRAVERLHDDPELRRDLGRAAHAQAAELWSLEALGPQWRRCYEKAMEQPKRGGPVLPAPATAHPGCERFMRGLGPEAEPFRASLEGDSAEAAAADERIAATGDVVAYSGGGLLDFRRRHPDDEMLALWTGLFLAQRGRPALAAAELERARRLGSGRAAAALAGEAATA